MMKKTVFLAAVLGAIASASFAENQLVTMGNGQNEALSRSFDRSLDQFGCVGSVAVEIPDIQFGNDQASLTAEGQKQTGAIAALMMNERFRDDHFVIDGHASAPGTDFHNLDLSRRRAETIYHTLLRRGLTKDRLSYRYFGERRLLYPDRPDHAFNRRVTIRRVGFNSASEEAYQAQDRNTHSIAVRFMTRDANTGTLFSADPARDVFALGAPLYLCVSTSHAGWLTVESREAGESGYSLAGQWMIDAAGLARIPERGAWQFSGRPGTETIRLRHMDCNIAHCPNRVLAGLESIQIATHRTGARKAPATTPAAQPSCEALGVTCLTVTVQRK